MHAQHAQESTVTLAVLAVVTGVCFAGAIAAIAFALTGR
jgi:hypothetical protein